MNENIVCQFIENELGEEEMPVNDYYEATPPITDNILSNAVNEDYGRTPTLYPEALLTKKYRNHFITIPQSKQNLDELNTSIKSTRLPC